MPRQTDARRTEREAMEIVLREERANGWRPEPLLGQRSQAMEGCDFLSYPAEGGDAHRVEVKGWGESLLATNGTFRHPADINAEQFARADRDPNWRLEIVANLTAARTGKGAPERLTLTSEEVRSRARPAQYRIPLEGLAGRIRRFAAD